MNGIHHIIWLMTVCIVFALYHIWVIAPLKNHNANYYYQTYHVGYQTFEDNYKQHIGACNETIEVLLKEHNIAFVKWNPGDPLDDRYKDKPLQPQIIVKYCKHEKEEINIDK